MGEQQMNKMIWSPQHQKYISTERQRSEFVSPLLPGGANVAQTHSSDLIRILTDAGVPGVSASNVRSANLDAYQKHLDAIGNAAADAAVNAWLVAKSERPA